MKLRGSLVVLLGLFLFIGESGAQESRRRISSLSESLHPSPVSNPKCESLTSELSDNSNLGSLLAITEQAALNELQSKESIGKSQQKSVRAGDIKLGQGKYKTVYRRMREEKGGGAQASAYFEFEPSSSVTKTEGEGQVSYLHRLREAQCFEHELLMLQANEKDQIPNSLRLEKVTKTAHRRFIRVHTEYVPGGSLADFMKAQKEPLSAREVLNLTSQLCQYLVATHKNKRVHRDLKPPNILVDDTSSPYRYRVSDLGFSYQKNEPFVWTKSHSWFAGSLRYTTPLLQVLKVISGTPLSSSKEEPNKRRTQIRLSSDFLYHAHSDSDWHALRVSIMESVLGAEAKVEINKTRRWTPDQVVNVTDTKTLSELESEGDKQIFENLTQRALKKVKTDLEGMNRSRGESDSKIPSEFLLSKLTKLLACPGKFYSLSDCDEVQTQACSELTAEITGTQW